MTKKKKKKEKVRTGSDSGRTGGSVTKRKKERKIDRKKKNISLA